MIESSETNSVNYCSKKYLFCIDTSMDREKNEKFSLSYSDIDSDENFDELCFKSSTSSSFISFSDDDEDAENLSNIVVEEDDIIINSNLNSNCITTEQEIELNDQIKNIENQINQLDEKEDLKQHLKGNLEELKKRQHALIEQQAFFKESIKKHDDKRTRDLQKHLNQCSTTSFRNYDQISYLDIVKRACCNSLDFLNYSNASVSLITFNSNELKYYDGSSQTPLININFEKDLIDPDKFSESIKHNLDFNLDNFDFIIKNLNAQGNFSLSTFFLTSFKSILKKFLQF